MKKKTIAVAVFALCIFIFAAVRNLGCLAKSEASNDQSSGFQTAIMLDFIKGNASIVPCGPGSGGGRGPSMTICEY
jgi:hypothetical protein